MSGKTEKQKVELYEKKEHILYLFTDIAQNRNRLGEAVFDEIVTRVKGVTKYNMHHCTLDVDDVIFWLENDIWEKLYDKKYEYFTNSARKNV